VLGFLPVIELVVIPAAALLFTLDLFEVGPGVLAIALVGDAGAGTPNEVGVNSHS
jgi:hypothetical protein